MENRRLRKEDWHLWRIRQKSSTDPRPRTKNNWGRLAKFFRVAFAVLLEGQIKEAKR